MVSACALFLRLLSIHDAPKRPLLVAPPPTPLPSGQVRARRQSFQNPSKKLVSLYKMPLVSPPRIYSSSSWDTPLLSDHAVALSWWRSSRGVVHRVASAGIHVRRLLQLDISAVISLIAVICVARLLESHRRLVGRSIGVVIGLVGVGTISRSAYPACAIHRGQAEAATATIPEASEERVRKSPTGADEFSAGGVREVGDLRKCEEDENEEDNDSCCQHPSPPAVPIGIAVPVVIVEAVTAKRC